MEVGRSASPAKRRSRHQRRKPQTATAYHPHDRTAPRHRQDACVGRTGTPPAHTVSPWSHGMWARRTVWLVTLLTLLLRVRHVFQESAWWILHPDEIYQSLEVAYSELHGYGFRTYEFLPPAEKDNPSLYSQKERQLGMFALRSPLFPRFYSTVAWLTSVAGCDLQPYLVWRVAHIVVSSLLPLAVDRLVMSVFRCRVTGMVAAMLTACSVFTNVVASHTLIHGFLAPILFSSLAGILSHLCPKEDSEKDASACVANPTLGSSDIEDSNCSRKEFHTSSHEEKEVALCDSSLLRTHSSQRAEMQDLSSPGSGNGYLKENNNLQIKDFNQKYRGCSLGRQVSAPVTLLLHLCYSSLCGIVKKYVIHALSIRKFTSSSVLFDRQSEEEIQVHQFHEKSPKSSTRSSLLCSPNLSDETGCRPTDNNCRRIQERKTAKFLSFEWENLSLEVGSFLKISTNAFVLSLCCYVRPDSILLIVGVVCLLVPRSHLADAATSRRTLGAVAGCLAGVLLGVCDDAYFYGSFTVTPWNWFWFNVASGVQSQLFGTDSIMLYVNELLWKNAGMRVLFAANVIALVVTMRPLQERTSKISFRAEKTFRFISCLLIMLVIFSLQSHKEVRFIYNAVVVYLCLSAASLVSLAQMFLKKPSFRAISVAMVTILYAVSQWLDFPIAGDLSARTWTYRESVDSYDVSRCVSFISRQSDVRGVFINKHLHTFGGYTMLGHDVPILVRTFTGYHEYGFSARTKTTSRNWFGSTKEISLVTSSRVSNLFSDFNKPHLVLHLINHAEYNYLVLDAEDDFLQAGFKEVYVHGRLKVLKRLGTEADEKKLLALLPMLKVTPSADILEKEAQELFAFGLKERANERYREAQQIKLRRNLKINGK